MPRLKQPQSLFSLSTSHTSIHIWISVKKHCSSSCKFCGQLILIEKCTLLQNLKEAISELPMCCVQNIYKYLCSVLLNSFNGSLYKYRSLLYTVCWIFCCKYIRISRWSLEINEDFYFLKRFGSYLDNLNLHFAPHDYAQWKLIFGYAENISAFTSEYFYASENFLRAIGEECKQIKSLKIYITTKIRPEAFLKLCFQDIGTQEIKNKCCDTLEVLHLYGLEFINFGLFIDEAEIENPASILNKIYDIVLRNLSNLKSVGSWFDIDSYLNFLNKENVPTTMITEGKITTLTVYGLELLKILAPNLKNVEINLERSELDALGTFISETSIKCLKLRSKVRFGVDELLYENLFLTKVTNLHSLDLRGINVMKLNISMLASNLPNLKVFAVDHFLEAIWNNVVAFQNLEEACFTYFPSVHVEPFKWCASFSGSIKHLTIACRLTYTDAKVNTFVQDCYPEMEYLLVQGLSCDSDFLIAILKNCPRLRNISGVTCRNYNLVWEYIQDMQR